MKPVRVLIVDDERPARLKIRRHLKNRPEVGSIEEAHDGLAAVETIRRDPPDLVFLDIQMPGLNGFEVIEAVGVEAMPKVVFVTAFDDHAIAAFDVEALDYLLKPYSDERFDKAFKTLRGEGQITVPIGACMLVAITLLYQRGAQQAAEALRFALQQEDDDARKG